MHRIDTMTAQTDKFGVGKNGFTNGDPVTGRRATDLNSDMWDAVQEELCTVVERVGIELDKTQHDQLYQAILNLTKGCLLNVRVMTESGTYIPTPGTQKIIVEAVGGGGDASDLSGLDAGEFAIGAGGGGGAYIKALIRNIADAYDVTVGAAGGMSLFGELLSVAGGSAGSYETGNAAMPEIIATATSHADLRYSEGVIVMAQMYGARGGYGYSVSDKLKFAGNGGGSPLGAGGEFSGDVHSAALPGSGYGAGGSGAVLISTGPSDSAAGGKGTPGVVIIYEYS